MAKTRFHSLLEGKINLEVEKRASSLLNGEATDYARYIGSVEYIRGLRDSLKLCEEIEREMD